MNIRELMVVALASIKSSKLRSFLTTLGIVIGIAAVISVVAIGQGGRAMLMQELEKICRIAQKIYPDQIDTLLTLDAATGQNALQQMETFKQWVNPSGIILTKLDGSAKGGVAIALAEKFKIPIKYIGVGEGIDDLLPFSPESYIDSLLPTE